MKRSALEHWDTSNPIIVAARVKMMLSESECKEILAEYGHSIREWPVNATDIYPGELSPNIPTEKILYAYNFMLEVQ